MGILDEAIREHLELKRKHGAEGGELRQLEDEAFGQAERPGGEGAPEESAPEAAETQVLSQIPAADAEVAEAPESGRTEEDASTGEPVSEEPSAVTPEPGEDPDSVAGASGPATSEREAIAQQPTEIFDVASELAREKGEERESDAVEPAEEAASNEAAKPVVPEDAAAQEAVPPELEVPPPPPVTEEEQPQAEESGAEPENASPGEIFDDQSLSDELDQALDGPAAREERRAAFFEETDEFRTPAQRPSRGADFPETGEEGFPETSEEDVLEETPEFLEETPEHDRLWFEQKPPKDFDFND